MVRPWPRRTNFFERSRKAPVFPAQRSEEHTSELQSHSDLVCRLLLEKKKNQRIQHERRIRDARKKRQSESKHQNRPKIHFHNNMRLNFKADKTKTLTLHSEDTTIKHG